MKNWTLPHRAHAQKVGKVCQVRNVSTFGVQGEYGGKIEMFNGCGVSSEHFMGLTLCEANSLWATMKCTRFLTGRISWGELTTCTRRNNYLSVFWHSVRWHFSSTLWSGYTDSVIISNQKSFFKDTLFSE